MFSKLNMFNMFNMSNTFNMFNVVAFIVEQPHFSN